MFQISLRELDAFIVKPSRRKKDNAYHGANDTVSIVSTTQGKHRGDGININIHVDDFLGYGFLKIYVIGNRIYMYPLNFNDPNYDGDECFTLSQNPTMRTFNTKVGNPFGVEKLTDFLGEYKIKREMDSSNQYKLFYIEK